MKKRKEKKEENYIKKGEKGFKIASFLGINSKKNRGHCTANSFVGEKIKSQKRGGGNDQNAQYISLTWSDTDAERKCESVSFTIK